MGARFIIHPSGTQFHFTLFAANNEKILASERYTAKAGAQNGVQSVKTNAPNEARYERRNLTRNEPYFVLKAANGEIIGTSEMYSSPTRGRNCSSRVSSLHTR